MARSTARKTKSSAKQLARRNSTALRGRNIQARRDALDRAKQGKPKRDEQKADRATGTSAKQHLKKPGLEKDMVPRPHYQAPSYKGSEKLKDKVALITGADSGIGRAVAILYAREGADIAIVYLNEDEDAFETAQEVRKEGRRAILIPGDVTDFDFCQNAVEQTLQEFGKLDILVNNAAFQEHVDSFDELSIEQWDLTFKTNIYGYFYMAKAALPHMKEGGAVINTGSVNAFRGNKSLIDYSATKGAIHAFTKSLAMSLVEKKIRVNCVAPGPVWTPFIPSDSPEVSLDEFGKSVPMERAAQPEEVAPSFVFFAAESDSSYITGEVLGVLGGEPMGA
ncbi:MAG: SDR family oxidoreductase [Bdellovibrionia bacterium]